MSTVAQGMSEGTHGVHSSQKLCLEREASTSAALGEHAAGRGWGTPGQARPSSGAMPWVVKLRPWSRLPDWSRRLSREAADRGGQSRCLR